MQIDSGVPYLIIKEVWSEHEHSFYQEESKWLLENLAGRLRKISWHRIESDNADALLFLFQTDWFNSVKIGSGGSIILERRRGHIFFIIRIEDILRIKKYGAIRHQNNQHKKKAKKRAKSPLFYMV